MNFLGFIFSIFAVLAVFNVFPAAAEANYNYGYYGNPFGTPISGQYGYNRPSYVPPVQVPTPVIVPQPIYVPQPVYVQKPVYIQQPVYVPQPTYYPTPSYYPALSVTCSANATYANIYFPVTWTAHASGGNGLYNYSWRGTDGLSGSGQSITYSYSNSGTKTAQVTLYSGGQSITRDCSSVVTVTNYSGSSYPYYDQPYQPAYQQPVYQQGVIYGTGNSANLDIGCFADPVNITVNSSVTWTAEVTGGLAPYTYSWTGSDGLSGSQNSIIKYYSSTGSKSAIVTITSADGRTGVRACSNAVTVAGAARAPIAQVAVPAAPAQSSQNIQQSPAPIAPLNQTGNISSAPYFSLAGAPWGFIALLVILVLFFTVIYLLFEKREIMK